MISFFYIQGMALSAIAWEWTSSL